MDDDEQVEDDDAPQLRKYTLEEANATLADVRPVLLELRELWTGANDEREAFEHAQSSDQSPVDVSQTHQHLVSALWDVQPLVAWLRERDIVLRDPATGLIDFFAEVGGEDGFLCWRLGEDQIDYWHGTDEGFANRKPL